jgi:hypothetical protein
MAAKADDPTKVWTLADLVKRGESVYAANCVACHQANGKGAGPIKALDGSAIGLDADMPRSPRSCSMVRQAVPCRPGSSCLTPNSRPS